MKIDHEKPSSVTKETSVNVENTAGEIGKKNKKIKEAKKKKVSPGKGPQNAVTAISTGDQYSTARPPDDQGRTTSPVDGQGRTDPRGGGQGRTDPRVNGQGRNDPQRDGRGRTDQQAAGNVHTGSSASLQTEGRDGNAIDVCSFFVTEDQRPHGAMGKVTGEKSNLVMSYDASNRYVTSSKLRMLY